MSSDNKELVKFLDDFYNQSGIRIRPGVKSDCLEIERLIWELAVFQKKDGCPEIDHKVLEHDGFEVATPLFRLLVAEAPEEDKHEDHRLIGYALYNYKYSTWVGKAMLLEDLYCSENYRNRKVGSTMFRAVAKIAKFENCARMDLDVLAWNPARKFYERHGGTNITESEYWHFYRFAKADLEAL